ncbi:transposase [Cuneatibacter caecimuris]|uniref:Transposase n=1 Tax=Cuneatibacter caecimuris TaxID=1796618 RepID=A0A4Q7NZE9_9FIRM|nr:transposase [Cuneatibacter caecimuris]
MSVKKQYRPRRSYTADIKQELVDLYRSGRHKCNIIREFDMASSLHGKWIAQSDNSGSSRKRTTARRSEWQELIELRKQNQQL